MDPGPVADVIETVTGVRLRDDPDREILRERLGRNRHRAARRAAERNDEAIANEVVPVVVEGEVAVPRLASA